jgi:hypothetical protein
VLEKFVEDVNSTQCILFGDNSKDLSLENVMFVTPLAIIFF